MVWSFLNGFFKQFVNGFIKWYLCRWSWRRLLVLLVTAQWSILLAFFSRCFPSFCPLMPAGPDFRYTNFSGGRSTPRKPVKRHNGRFYWLTRDVSQLLWTPPGPDFRYTNFSGGPNFRILHTHIFLGGRGFAFYLHALFGRPGFSHFSYTNFSGCRHRRSCIWGTQTFRVAGVLHFTYTHFRGDSYANLRKMMSTLEKFSALRAAFFLSRKESETYIEKISALRVRPSSAAMLKERKYTLKKFPRCARKIVSK